MTPYDRVTQTSWVPCQEAEAIKADYDVPETLVWIEEHSKIDDDEWTRPILHGEPEFIPAPLEFNRYT